MFFILKHPVSSSSSSQTYMAWICHVLILRIFSGCPWRGWSCRCYWTQSKLTVCISLHYSLTDWLSDVLLTVTVSPSPGRARFPRRERSCRHSGSAGTSRSAWNSWNWRTQGESNIWSKTRSSKLLSPEEFSHHWQICFCGQFSDSFLPHTAAATH